MTRQPLLAVPSNCDAPADGRPSEAKHFDPRRYLRGGLLLALLTLGPAALTETYESFDCSDSTYTEPRSINDRDDIVGICADENGPHGFLLRRSDFTLIDFPGASGPPFAFGTSNRGDVVGRYVGADTLHGYLLRRGRFTTIDVPDSSFPRALETVTYGINASGQVVGVYAGADGGVDGFLRDPDGGNGDSGGIGGRSTRAHTLTRGGRPW
jgi:hypothetical protein